MREPLPPEVPNPDENGLDDRPANIESCSSGDAQTLSLYGFDYSDSDDEQERPLTRADALRDADDLPVVHPSPLQKARSLPSRLSDTHPPADESSHPLDRAKTFSQRS